MAGSVLNMSSAVTLLTLVLLAMLCSSVKGAYFYNRNANSNANKYPRTAGYYSSGATTQPHTSHHKHHHVSNNGRLHQAAVGIISGGRLVPYTASTVTTTTSSKLSPLDRLINRLDSEGRKSPQSNHQSHVTGFDQGNGRHESYFGSYPRRDHVSSSMLRSSADHRYAQIRSRIEDSYEDDDEDEDEDDDDVIDDGDNIRDEEDDEENEDEEMLSRGRHQHPHRNHKSGTTGDNVTWYDGAVSDFPDHSPTSNPGSSGSGHEGGSGPRWGGFTSYSEWKWHVLNKPNMDMLRNHKGTYKAASSDTDLAKAVQHALTVSREGQCRVPKPRLIQVKDVYPHPSKTYIPHCTILHLCGDDTGCCKSDTLTCIARKTEQVDLYFYTTTLRTSAVPRSRGGPTVEKLSFHNHTECVCVDRLEEFMPRDRPSSGNDKDNVGVHGFRGYYRPDADSSSSESKSCRCPSQFSARHVDGSCVCECFDKQRDCIRSKRGKEYIPHDDRICIMRGECMAPSCEFGTYLRRAGRCPRKREKFEAWQQYPLHDEEYK